MLGKFGLRDRLGQGGQGVIPCGHHDKLDGSQAFAGQGGLQQRQRPDDAKAATAIENRLVCRSDCLDKEP